MPWTVSPRQAAHGEERRRGGAGIARIRGFERVADDQLDEPVVVELADGHGGDLPSVAEHGDAVGEFEHLVEVVGDVQDRDPTRSQAVDHLEQTLDVLPRQRRRRLVEDQQAGTVLPADECSGDGDRRAVRLRQRVDRSLHVDVVEAEDRQRVTGALRFLTPPDVSAEARRVPGA